MGTTTVTAVREMDATPEEVWEVVSDTSRYADWVDGVLEVTRHHGTAVEGRTYAERNRTMGPLTTASEWTVREVEPTRRRVDTGTGFEPLRDMVNTFVLEPLDGAGTRMTYQVEFRVALGPLGGLVGRLLSGGLRGEFERSMQALEDLVVSERVIA